MIGGVFLKTKTFILGIFVIIISTIFNEYLWMLITNLPYMGFLITDPVMDSQIPILSLTVRELAKSIIIGVFSMLGFRISWRSLK